MTAGLCLDAIGRSLPPGWHLRKEDPVRIPDRDSEPEPDVSVACGTRTRYLDHHPGPNEMALVVEVADPRVEDDREMAVTYGGGGIPVYWLVNIPTVSSSLHEPSGPIDSHRLPSLHSAPSRRSRSPDRRGKGRYLHPRQRSSPTPDARFRRARLIKGQSNSSLDMQP